MKLQVQILSATVPKDQPCEHSYFSLYLQIMKNILRKDARRAFVYWMKSHIDEVFIKIFIYLRFHILTIYNPFSQVLLLTHNFSWKNGPFPPYGDEPYGPQQYHGTSPSPDHFGLPLPWWGSWPHDDDGEYRRRSSPDPFPHTWVIEIIEFQNGKVVI